MTKPTVGHIVHYTSRGSADGYFMPVERAAIIVEVEYADRYFGSDDDPEYPEDNYDVTLMVCNPSGIFFDEKVIFSPEPKPGCWSWPPRV